MEEYRIKPWNELTIQDDYMFKLVMSRKRICKKMIEAEGVKYMTYAMKLMEERKEGRKEGFEEGSEKAFLSTVKALMEKQGLTIEQAMELLDVPVERREKIMTML